MARCSRIPIALLTRKADERVAGTNDNNNEFAAVPGLGRTRGESRTVVRTEMRNNRMWWGEPRVISPDHPRPL